jgi:hypothetical protein
MTKSINTLVEDVNKLLTTGVILSDEDKKELGTQFAEMISDRLKPRETNKGFLRMSSLGSPDRQLWFSVNHAEKREPFDGPTLLKFLYGDIVELFMLFLIKKAGHTVEAAQEEVDVAGIKGHPDAIIDGILVDLKTASGYGMKKFEKHLLEQEDPFHYLTQLSLYLHALKDDERLKVKKQGAFLAIDKSSGSAVLDTYSKLAIDIDKMVQEKKDMVTKPEPPDLCFQPIKDGVSGNMVLNTTCSYCGFKKLCHPNLRTFKYSSGNKYFTTVVKTPDVPEVT